MPEDWRMLVDSNLFKVDTSKVPEVSTAVQQYTALISLQCTCCEQHKCIHSLLVVDMFAMPRLQLIRVPLS